MDSLDRHQIETCLRFDVVPDPPRPGSKLGVSSNIREVVSPLHGLRHAPEGDTNGWYIWRGNYDDDPGFFAPLHLEHVGEWCPEVSLHLALPAGWRFLLAPDHEDVWFDVNLLDGQPLP